MNTAAVCLETSSSETSDFVAIAQYIRGPRLLAVETLFGSRRGSTMPWGIEQGLSAVPSHFVPIDLSAFLPLFRQSSPATPSGIIYLGQRSSIWRTRVPSCDTRQCISLIEGFVSFSTHHFDWYIPMSLLHDVLTVASHGLCQTLR